MKIDPVAMQLLEMLAQYSTFDEVLVANKLFCLKGPWRAFSLGDKQINWWRESASKILLSLSRRGNLSMFGPPCAKTLAELPSFLEKIKCASSSDDSVSGGSN